MKFFVTLIQVLSSLITIIAAYGLFVDPSSAVQVGLSEHQLKIALGLSFLIALFSYSLKVGPGNKLQIQIFGENNTQDMR